MQYYFALTTEPAILRPDHLFVWGDRPDSLDDENHACGYTMAVDTGVVVEGPCLYDIGVGESSDAIAVRCGCDGLL